MRQSENEAERTPPGTYIKALAPLEKNDNQGRQNQLQPITTSKSKSKSISTSASTEPNGTLYILKPVQKTKPPETRENPQKKQPPAPQLPAAALVPATQTAHAAAIYPQAMRNNLNNRNTQNARESKTAHSSGKKLPPVKRLINRFRKNGLGRIDSYFNAYFFYYDWKSEKKGRRPKEYLRTVARHPRGWAKKTNEAVYEKNIYDRYLSLLTVIAKISGAVSAVFTQIGNIFGKSKNKTKSKSKALETVGNITKAVCRMLIPAAVAVLTFMTILNINSYKPQLEFSLNGQEIGFVKSKETVEKAVSLLEYNVSSVLNEPYEFTGGISYRIILSKTQTYVSASEIYDIMYRSSQSAVTLAYGLYIDGELVGAAENESDINRVLNEVLEEIAEKTAGESIEFANEIKIIEDKYAVRDVVTQSELKNIISYSAENSENPREEEEEIDTDLFPAAFSVEGANGKSKKYAYDIADSDVPLSSGVFLAGGPEDESSSPLSSSSSSEASAGAEDLAVMAAANSLSLTPEAVNTIPRGFMDSVSKLDENSLGGGLFLKLAKVPENTAASAIQLKRTKPETYIITVPFDVKYVESTNYYTGTQVVQKNGANGENQITAEVTYIGENEVSREILSIETLKEPESKVVVIGTKPKPLPGPTGAYIRPVKGGYITSRFGKGHRGVDLVVPFGTKIGAADGGVVIYAGFSGSYGNHVKIRHNDGFVTLYAHLSSISVKNGDKVFQDQKIGEVGSTGNSSGNHLHFEMIKNGVLVNPENYIR